MLYRISTLFLCLIFALALPACDSDGDDGDGGGGGGGGGLIGSSSVTVSGAFSDSFSGSAAFGVDEDDNDFSLALFEGSITTASGGIVAIGRSDGGRPAVGSYSLAAGSDFTAGYVGDVSSTTGGDFVGATSGTLNISASSEDEVRGTFTFTGLTFTGAQATVEGSFTAVFADTIPSTGF